MPRGCGSSLRRASSRRRRRPTSRSAPGGGRWTRSNDAAPKRLALIHFGVADDVERHLAELRERLGAWAELVEQGATEAEFVAAARADVPAADADAYDRAMPFWQSYAGLARWATKRRES